MAVFVANIVRDKGLEYFSTLSNVKMTVCSAEPTTFEEANTTYDGTSGKLKTGEVALSSGDFTLQAGTPNGRQVLIAPKSVTLSFTNGPASNSYVAILDVGSSTLLAYSDFSARTADSGDTLDIGSWHIRMGTAAPE